VSFSSPVTIAANTTYVASYFVPNGNYSITGNAFSGSGVDNAPLHALAAGVDGNNGVYKYGTSSGFPNASYLNTNYWVDVVVSTGPPPVDTTPPTVSVTSPLAGATGVATSVLPSATFSEAVQSATVGFSLAAGATAVSGSSAYNAGSKTATFTPAAALAASTTYTATVSGVKDTAGNVIAAPVSWSFTTASVAGTCPCSIWSAGATPAGADPDTAALELGVKFRSDVAGQVTGVRFYKGTGNSGTHLGSLWSSTGTLLASATFTGESASGWQQVSFSSPVTIAANTTYVASYFAPAGVYSYTQNVFTAGVDNVPLHALQSGVDGTNGVYKYGTSSGFPNASYLNTNYWVDVVMTTAAPPTNVTLTDSSVADFSGGTQSGTAVVQTADGEVALAPAGGNEFAGAVLPTGWTSTNIVTGGTAVVGGGTLTLNGKRVNTSATYSAGRSLEFVATFLAENGQNVGFGTTLGSTTPYAIFGVSGGTLQALTRLNGTTSSSTNLATTYLNAPHRYRVDWNATNVVYSIDGVVVATHARTLTVAMPIMARDSVLGALPLVVDWMRLGPYPTSGAFTSRVLDAGQSLLYDTVTWTADLPAGSSLAVEMRTGNTATPDASWSAFTAVTSGGSVGQTARYAQYRVTLTRGTAVLSPSLSALSVVAHI
jgi:hypothetical protein